MSEISLWLVTVSLAWPSSSVSHLVLSLVYLGLLLYALICDSLTGPLTFDNKSLCSLEVGSSLCTNFKCGGILFMRDIDPGTGQ